MFLRLIDHVNRLILNRFLPTPVLVGTHVPTQQNLSDIISTLKDGLVLATPKRRTPLRVRWFRKYGNDNFSNSTTLWKPKRNIVTCIECGNFHEIHAICRACYEKIEKESKSMIEGIRNMWGKGVIDKEVEILYQGETAASNFKRIVELERPRPLWFTSNLSQKSAKISKPPDQSTIESDSRTVRFKVDE